MSSSVDSVRSFELGRCCRGLNLWHCCPLLGYKFMPLRHICSGDGKEFDWNSFMRDCGVQQYLHCPDQSSNFPWSGWLWRLMVALTEECEANTHGFSVGHVSANMLLFQVHYWKECHTLDHYMQHADQFLFTKKIPSCSLLIRVNFVCQPWIDTVPSFMGWLAGM